MTNYSTNLKPWGASGSEYPDGYSYLEGEQPVDDWDNNFNHNVVLDIQHLISLTNERLDSGKGTSYPASPEDGHFMWRSDTQRASVYDGALGGWREFTYKNEFDAHNHNSEYVALTGGSISGSLTTSGLLKSTGGGLDSSVSVQNDTAGIDYRLVAKDTGNVEITDESNQVSMLQVTKDEFAISVPNDPTFNGNAIMHTGNGGDGSGFDADTVDGKHASELGVNIEEEGLVSVESATAVNFIGHLNVINDGDGTVTIDPTHNHDGRYARLYDGVQAPVYASTADVPSSITKGELVYIDGDGLYVEDGL